MNKQNNKAPKTIDVEDKLIKDTKKDKKMGATFWILTGLCVAMTIFIITVIIVRSV